jgi:ubiquinone/menaquinone biosynthesis C-methylase UbiE
MLVSTALPIDDAIDYTPNSPRSSTAAIRNTSLYKKFFAGVTNIQTHIHLKEIDEKKMHLFQNNVYGEVLEIGAGAGSNFRLLDQLQSKVLYTAVEPNEYMHDHLIQEANKYEIPVESILACSAEYMPTLADSSFDVILCTHVLSCVDDVDAVLQEVARLLKPGGKFLFMENVAAPKKSKKRKVQNIITPLTRVIANGKEYNREIWNNIQEVSEFKTVEIHDFKWNNTPQIYGVAMKNDGKDEEEDLVESSVLDNIDSKAGTSLDASTLGTDLACSPSPCNLVIE